MRSLRTVCTTGLIVGLLVQGLGVNQALADPPPDLEEFIVCRDAQTLERLLRLNIDEVHARIREAQMAPTQSEIDYLRAELGEVNNRIPELEALQSKDRQAFLAAWDAAKTEFERAHLSSNYDERRVSLESLLQEDRHAQRWLNQRIQELETQLRLGSLFSGSVPVTATRQYRRHYGPVHTDPAPISGERAREIYRRAMQEEGKR